MATRFDVKSLVSVGPLKFGMSRKSVENAVGPPDSVSKFAPLKQIKEERKGYLCLFEASKLVHVRFSPGARLFFENFEIFKTKDIANNLKERDDTWDQGNGYFNFPKLGLCVGGFGRKRIPEGKLVYAYSKTKVDWFKSFLAV